MAGGRAMTQVADWLAEVPERPIADRDLAVRFVMLPGDRPLVDAGDHVQPGDALFERLRDRRIEEVVISSPPGVATGSATRSATGPGTGAAAGTRGDATGGGEAGPATGRRWTPVVTSRIHRHVSGGEGELLAPIPGRRDRWRMITGERRDPVEAPIAGMVASVVPGTEIVVRTEGLAVRGALAAGVPAHGRLELATDPFGELRPGGIDVGRAGSVLVVGARIDAEALTRARAMGVRGIVVASLSGKDLRDFRASERRQRASLHAAPPFAVIALDGAVRRRIPSPVATLLARLAGRDVGLVMDPPGLVFDPAGIELPEIDPAWVRIRSGPGAGAEGRVMGPAGMHRFGSGVQLEAMLVALDSEPPHPVPIGDLERLAWPQATR